MTELEKKISELSTKASMLEMGPYDQWQKAQPIWDEIKKLDHGRKGYVIELRWTNPNYSHRPFYLGKNDITHFSDRPNYFETEEEAREYLNEADLDESDIQIEIKYMEGRE